MSYSIVGFGKIGHALAKAFAPQGIEGHDVSAGRATMHGSDRAQPDPCEMEKFP